MKKVVNALTLLRIALSVIILFLQPFKIMFSILYIMCGISDILDGYLARKFEVTSSKGAFLDTTGDFIMFIAVMVKVIPIITIPPYIIIWVLVIATVKMISIIICFFKYHSFVILHTYGNKITGLSLFMMVLLYPLIPYTFLYILVSAVASWASLEEIVVNIKSRKLNRDIKHINFKIVHRKVMNNGERQHIIKK